MLIGTQQTVLGQSLIHPDCKGLHYTEIQDKRCLECLINKPKKLTLIALLKSDTLLLRGQINEFKGKEKIYKESIANLKVSLSSERTKLKFSLKLNKFGIPVALGGGLFLGILLVK